MLRQQIYEDMIAAMKAKEADKLETVRFVWSEIKKTEIDAKHELSDEEVTKLLRTEVKRRREAVEQMKAGGRQDLVEQETAQLKVIEAYLPQQMGAEEVEKLVEEVLAGGAIEFGLIMKEVMAKAQGKADGKMVSEVVRKKANG